MTAQRFPLWRQWYWVAQRVARTPEGQGENPLHSHVVTPASWGTGTQAGGRKVSPTPCATSLWVHPHLPARVGTGWAGRLMLCFMVCRGESRCSAEAGARLGSRAATLGHPKRVLSLSPRLREADSFRLESTMCTHARTHIYSRIHILTCTHTGWKPSPVDYFAFSWRPSCGDSSWQNLGRGGCCRAELAVGGMEQWASQSNHPPWSAGPLCRPGWWP